MTERITVCVAFDPMGARHHDCQLRSIDYPVDAPVYDVPGRKTGVSMAGIPNRI
jgi:hypothetical protein